MQILDRLRSPSLVGRFRRRPNIVVRKTVGCAMRKSACERAGHNSVLDVEVRGIARHLDTSVDRRKAGSVRTRCVSRRDAQCAKCGGLSLRRGDKSGGGACPPNRLARPPGASPSITAALRFRLAVLVACLAASSCRTRPSGEAGASECSSSRPCDGWAARAGSGRGMRVERVDAEAPSGKLRAAEVVGWQDDEWTYFHAQEGP